MPVLAYLDLGAGSMLLQMIMAGVLGLGFTVRAYWRRTSAWLRRGKTAETDDLAERPQREDIA